MLKEDPRKWTERRERMLDDAYDRRHLLAILIKEKKVGSPEYNEIFQHLRENHANIAILQECKQLLVKGYKP